MTAVTTTSSMTVAPAMLAGARPGAGVGTATGAGGAITLQQPRGCNHDEQAARVTAASYRLRHTVTYDRGE